MERELRIVISVFLVYFIFALTSLFSYGTFLTFFFLGKLTLAAVALVFYFMNIAARRSWILLLYILATVCLALNDQYTIALLERLYDTALFDQLANSRLFLTLSVSYYIGFILFSLGYFHFIMRKTGQTIVLSSVVILFVLVLLANFMLAAEILFHLFFISFFVLTQRDSELKDKALQVLSCQYLLLVLLESFEYFV